MKKRNIYLTILLGISLLFVSCSEFLDENLSNEKTDETLMDNPSLVRGLLTTAYRAIPKSYESSKDFLDCATDNAVSNQLTGNYNKIESIDKYWSAVNNPLNNWNNSYESIRHINDFLVRGIYSGMVLDPSSEEANVYYVDRVKGEAFFLRAWIYADLLKRFGGKDEAGNRLGIPIITEVLDASAENLLPRNSYDDCVAFILSDLDTAMATVLPEVKWDGDIDLNDEGNLGRPTKLACLALKSRVLLYAASPAFSDAATSTERWTKAAQAAADAIAMLKASGVAVLPDIYNPFAVSTGYYNDDQNDELIMRRINGGKNGLTNTLEINQSIPSISGSGIVNPSHNLVEAFPMADGYPRGLSPTYSADDADMYFNRDPRMECAILFNGATFNYKSNLSTVVETFVGGKDYPGATDLATPERSTRTGYYLRKWLSSTADAKSAKDVHYYALFRQAELYLNFAEAALAAGDITIDGMTAKSTIAELRARALFPFGGADDYLEAQAGDATQLKALIQNERRLELCFEGHRFWDLRRWEQNLTETINGIKIEADELGVLNYTVVPVVNPKYNNTNYYCPLPWKEILKVSDDVLKQNAGW